MTAFNVYNGNGSQTQFPITFDYFNVSEIEVLLWNSAVSKWQQKTNTVDYNIASTNINFVAAPAAPTSGITGNVLILRKTEVGTTTLTDAQAVYSPGSAINAADLNKNQIQALRAVLDLRDSNMPIHGKTWADSSQETRLYSDLNMTGREIKNVGKIKVETLAYTENGVEIEQDTKNAFTAFSEIALKDDITSVNTKLALNVTNEDAKLATKADLVSGKVPASQIPEIAISSYLGPAANQTAMLALTGEEGDWCTRTDDGKVYVITGPDPTLIYSWTALTYPAAPSTFVTSVAGRSGVVTLSTSDVSGLSTVATSGSYNDLSSQPLTPWSTATGGINYASGNVGIGVTDPQAKLDVNGTLVVNASSLNTESTELRFGLSSAGVQGKTAIIATPTGAWGRQNLDICLNSAASTANASISDSKVVIRNNGNVGIGTDNPSQKLEVSGAFLVSNPLQPKVLFEETTGNQTYSFRVDASAGFRLRDETENADRITVSTSGNFGIGTGSPTALLDVNGDAIINSLTIGRGGGDVSSNVANGYQALYSNTTGISNVAIGSQALYSNTTGGSNVAIGRNALYFNTTGSNNTANGRHALYFNTTGSGNIATGYQALYFNTTGINNVASGRAALYSNTTGSGNIATGYQALYLNTTGINNTAIGRQSLYSNTTGGSNVASGRAALYSNTTGNSNTAIGRRALLDNTTGTDNTTLGYQAGSALTTGSNNTIIGAIQGTAGLSDTVIIGAGATERLRIDSSGNVGIGTSSPSRQLDVRTGSFNSAVAQFTGANDGRGLLISTFLRASNDDSVDYDAQFGGHHTFSSSGSEHLRITNTGNVGIGTDNPQDPLEIKGSANIALRLTDTTGGCSRIEYTEGTTSSKLTIEADPFNASTPDTKINFEIDGSEKMRIISTGNVGIGTSYPNAKLDVRGTSDSPSLTFNGSGQAIVGDSASQLAIGRVSSNPFSLYLQGRASNNGVRNISLAPVGGNVGIGTSSPSALLHLAANAPYITFEDKDNNQDWQLQATAGFALRNQTTNSELLRVNANGNVGIGVDEPQAKLHVKGNSDTKIRLENTNGGRTTFDPDEAGIDLTANGMNNTNKYTPSINFGSTDGDLTTTNPKFGAAINANSAQLYDADTTGGMDINFWTSPSSPGTDHGLVQRMTISSSGNVGIGVTDPQAKLAVNGNITSNGVAVALTSDLTPKVAVYKAASGSTQNIDATTDTLLDISTASISDTNFSNTSGAITISEAGVYEIHCSVGITGTTTNYRYTGKLTCNLNGVGQAEVQGGYIRATSGSLNSFIDMTHVLSVSANDVVTFAIKRISTTSGDATTIDGISRIIIKKL